MIAAVSALLLSSCSKSVEIVVKDKAGMPYIGAQITILNVNVPEIEKDVIIDKQRRDQNDLEERLVIVGATKEEAKERAKKQYDTYQEERPSMAPYGYVTNEMWSESARAFNDKWMEIIVSDVKSGKTNALGTWNVKLKEGDYYVYIEGSSREQRYYGPLSVYDSGTKVYTLK